ncbi:15370_t:CDS:2, partial [Funneliformis caledonium]
AQPNYTNLSQALQTLAHEVTFVPNMPNLNVANQLTIIQRSLSNLTDNITDLTDTVKNLSNRIDDLTITIQTTAENTDARNLARIFNSRLSSPDLQLELVPDMAGNVPQNYPQSITAFREMTDHSLNSLMAFYGLQPTGTVEARRKRFAKYIGVQLF